MIADIAVTGFSRKRSRFGSGDSWWKAAIQINKLGSLEPMIIPATTALNNCLLDCLPEAYSISLDPLGADGSRNNFNISVNQ